MKKIIVALMAVLILSTITPITSQAYTEEEWIAKIRQEQEEYMDELEAEGNLTQHAIDSITKGKSNRKPNSNHNNGKTKKNTSNASSYTSTSEAKGWVYSTDELHIVGLPEDAETGYTKAGDYGIIPVE